MRTPRSSATGAAPKEQRKHCQKGDGSVMAVSLHPGQAALGIPLEAGHHPGRTQAQTLDDESMHGPFVVHAQGRQFLLVPPRDGRLIQGFANVLYLSGAQMQFNLAPCCIKRCNCLRQFIAENLQNLMRASMTPGDLAATTCHRMGEPLDTPCRDHRGRPTYIVDQGAPIRELI